MNKDIKMIDIHADALSNKISCHHEFLSRYSKTKSVVYGFVEGKNDPCFYRGFVDSTIPDNWEIELWAAGNKEQVFNIYNIIDWQCFSEKRICFFVDRDLSDIIPENLHQDLNIYVTDKYSIENDISNKGTCKRILTEVCGFNNLTHDELEIACERFEEELDKFSTTMISVMAWILHWRRKKLRAYLGNIDMKHLFSFDNGYLQIISTPNGMNSWAEYIHDRCKIAYDASHDITSIEAELGSNEIYKKYTRGKYIFWFMIEFCLSVRQNSVTIFNSISSVPKMNVPLSSSNAMTIIGNRSRIPNSLKEFLEKTFCSYINIMDTKKA